MLKGKPKGLRKLMEMIIKSDLKTLISVKMLAFDYRKDLDKDVSICGRCHVEIPGMSQHSGMVSSLSGCHLHPDYDRFTSRSRFTNSIHCLLNTPLKT